MILELLAALLLCGAEPKRNNSTAYKRPRNNRDFEEADSFFDRHGNEHIVDDDGYCDDCDDYHDF